ncbi:17272_t:CDS:1, partial [Dentiscutata heterogama]
IYYNNSQKVKDIELLLTERLEKRLGDFKDDKKAFEFYSHLYINIPKYKSFENEALRYDRR